MNYNDVGYDNNLLRSLEAGYTEQVGIDSSTLFDQISGSQIKGDAINSLNQTLVLDLQNDSFVVKDGDIRRLELGRLSDNTIGMIIRDTQGNILMNISEAVNKIMSANGHVELDFNEERWIVYDEGLTPKIILGKQSGGF